MGRGTLRRDGTEAPVDNDTTTADPKAGLAMSSGGGDLLVVLLLWGFLSALVWIVLPVVALAAAVSAQTSRGKLQKTAWVLGVLGGVLLAIGLARAFLPGEEVSVVGLLFVGSVLGIPLLMLKAPPERRRRIGIAAWCVAGALLTVPLTIAVIAYST